MTFTKRAALLFAFSSAIIFAACTVHRYTKKEVLRITKREEKKYKLIVQDEGNTLKVLVRDSHYQKVDNIYDFDDRGKQLTYTAVYSCDSCVQKLLKKELSLKGFGWKKINDSMYLSRYSLKTSITVHKSTTIFEMATYEYPKSEYKAMLKNTGQ